MLLAFLFLELTLRQNSENKKMKNKK